MYKAFILLLFIFLGFHAHSQQEEKYSTANQPYWVQLMYSENADPGNVIKEYESYYASHEFIKNQNTQYYKRWIRSIGRETTINANSKESESYVKKSLFYANQKAPNSDWQCIGPRDFDFDAASRSYAPGAAHVYTVKHSVSDPTIMFAGTATAGLWKSTDAGQGWSLVTQNLVVNRIFAIEIDFSNPDIVYFESGGNLYKTTDGGVNWNIIGDAGFQAGDHAVKDIVMSPTNNQRIYLTSQIGFYVTTDGGANWTQIMAGEFQETELNPADPTMVYTIKVVNNKTEFYRSQDSGQTFSIQTAGWPNPIDPIDEQLRVEIAVTAANPNVIYANATGSANGGSGTYGIYKSTDNGSSWTFQCCGNQPAGPPSLTNKNLMGWDKEGQDDGGQYYYDVALEVDPNNANKLFLGGVNHWISEDGGVTWTCPAKWSEPGEPGYVHADIHDIRFLNGELWIACDGGLFKSTDGGASFSRSMFGIEGTDFWGFGASPQTDVMLGGAYHNGTLLKDNNAYTNGWICTGGGDGVRGFVNFGNDRWAYDDYEGRILSGDRTQNIQSFQFDSLPNSSYITGSSSNLEWDPRNINHIYLGRGKNLLKTEDNGASFEIVASFAANVMQIEQARTNLNVFYITTYQDWWGDKKIWRSTDGGQSFSDITPPNSLLVNETWVPYDIAVSGTDENTVWAVRTSQYSSYPNLNGKSVYKSTDAGATWVNYTTATLDGEWITNIEHQEGTDGGVYLGTRRAVYYRNNSMSDWQLFNNNLPLSTASTKLVIKYKDKKLRNATNRSVYEVELYETSEPIAQIAADRFKVNCMNEFVQYIDHSVLSSDNATWQWSFPGGFPNSSTVQNPLVQYTASGTYDVTLTVTDDYGTSTQSYTAFVEYVQNPTSLDVVEDFEAGVSSDWTLFNANNSYNWTETSVSDGPYCTTTNCLRLDHFNVDAVGDEAELITQTIDLSNALSAEIHFDYAYAKYGGSYEDGFRIDISTDCWDSFDTLWYKFGDSLATVPNESNFWTPTDCADWSVNNIVDISNFIGQDVMIRFVGINGWGNNFYLDNINITGQLADITSLSLGEIQVYPNPSQGTFVVVHDTPNLNYEVLSIDGKLIQTGVLGTAKSTIDVAAPSGVYVLLLNKNGQSTNRRIVIR